jgi:hypothetical protein
VINWPKPAAKHLNAYIQGICMRAFVAMSHSVYCIIACKLTPCIDNLFELLFRAVVVAWSLECEYTSLVNIVFLELNASCCGWKF